MEEIKELLETKQYTRLRQKLIELYDADIAQVLEEIPEEDMIKVFRILPKDKAADVFAYLEVEHQQMIITSLSERDAANIVNNMMADDAADLLEEMPANVVRRILASASADTRRDINHLLRYPDSSAGSIMTVEFVDLKENLTVAQALERVRKVGRDSETINNLYVLDKSRTLLGILTLRGLLLADPDKTVGEIMETNVVSVNTLMDQEDVAKQFKKYDFTAMPVVDNENRLVGIITVDDIVDIMEEETTEDIEKMAAIVPSDKPYMKTSVFETWKKRIPWLLLLMVSATFTGSIMKNFEEALGAIPALSFFIPMLMDTGGNAGGQASVTVIRGLSLEEIAFKDFFKVCWKEMRVAFLCGVTLAACNFLKLLFFDKVGVMIAFVVGITLIVAIFVAKLVGCSLPMVAKRLGFDPAVMASPFITTIVDALSLIVYFA
ncbi:MAG: magnesium transporter, partial [Lachnospiraceae bacterium]|nr:magnesium transporter [Lachnospiraceae bacterium]